MDVTLGGRYRTEELLGRGGSASVYRATDMVLGHEVAVKVFSSVTPVTDDDRYRRQRNESVMMTMLTHPGLVPLLEAGSHTDKAGATYNYFVMELINGGNLQARLSNRAALRSADVLQLGADLADTLRYVHAQGVVHRDVKPANILLTNPCGGDTTGLRARLTDFGIAHSVGSAGEAMAPDTSGTASYLSPEQAMGQHAGPGSDIYSLGLVLLEALTGQRTFPGSALAAATARLLHDPVIPTEFATPWRQLLSRMTAREPTIRPTAEDVADILSQWPPSLHNLPGEADARFHDRDCAKVRTFESSGLLTGAHFVPM